MRNVFEAILQSGHDEDFAPRITDDFVPTEAPAGRDRKRWLNRRREHDPLGEGHVETRRMRLIKVAAQTQVSTRRVLVRVSASWPFLKHYQAVSAAVNEACARLIPGTS